MSFGVKLRVRGQRACFTRPEMKVERVSYDVMTPSAARGILEAIHWKPAITWMIDRIHVLAPIRFQSIRRNEVGARAPVSNVRKAMKSGDLDGLRLIVENERQQRAATILHQVDYIIEAHFDMTAKAGACDNATKHREIFIRRAASGQCFHQPYFGTREFPADFELVEDDLPSSTLPQDQRNRDLGWMLLDIDHANDRVPLFFPASLKDGVMAVPSLNAPEIRS
ncbi:CRISPR-associated protein [Skermanella stibiiresistens SB22]|uniref:pre-crRNA processing endonuclease n=1 Tax=Skermanella stibiiresistens SB22 TaxID=1385369 RepID=W9H527_9PROT|nr:type I-C CRISPR-associated protein Cas5c [Skermanella stibiiresistens]EWY39807.1 CRISPR-associated protein [Skermanella stibiiresistens SB22]